MILQLGKTLHRMDIVHLRRLRIHVVSRTMFDALERDADLTCDESEYLTGGPRSFVVRCDAHIAVTPKSPPLSGPAKFLSRLQERQ